MSKPLKFSLKPDVYPHRFCLYFGEWDEDKITTYCMRAGILHGGGLEDPTGQCLAAHFKLDYGGLIWMPKKPDRASDYSYLMHEIVHAVSFCGRRIGMGSGEDAEEFYAYLTGWLSHQLFKKLW